VGSVYRFGESAEQVGGAALRQWAVEDRITACRLPFGQWHVDDSDVPRLRCSEKELEGAGVAAECDR
jgi:hypothetical protein